MKAKWDQLKMWFYMRPFWCRLDGHMWQWEPGSRPFCGVCKRTMTADEVIAAARDNTELWMREDQT